MVTLTINGTDISVEVDADTPLLWAIREEAGLTGTKFGCGIGQCGACTVLVNDTPVRSCSVPASAMQGQAITTIEGLASNDQLNPVQQAWLEWDVSQCGYCQSGQIMAATALVKQARHHERPTTEAIKQQINNICRCGTYNRILPAMERAFELAHKANSQEG
ncbi:MAG: (2Fe-2S)-binding protein [Gammaproteobacteria bacterium]|jgi:isoquinoline 1-oxidoreductase alpha subunit|nr:(2Fe-2S)-binding protein [Gammaproteobacteria bacterium]